MDVKLDGGALFDLSKICRACLNEKTDMRSLYMQDASTGAPMSLADMFESMSSIKVASDDGLPVLLCIDCVHQTISSFTFRRLCEQSDLNLRQYLGKPLPGPKPEAPKPAAKVPQDFALDSSSESSSDDDFKDEYSVMPPFIPDNPTDDKAVAQKQLLKAIKMHKNKLSKRRLLNKQNKGGTVVTKKIKRTSNQCDVCKKQFINLKYFRKHLMTHIEDRPFKCTVCNRGFTEENYLNNHMRTHVPDEQKPHECEVCKKRFFHSSLLSKHMLKHSGEKPFVCKICNKGCYAENSLLKHMKIHEKREGDPALLKHICDYCKTEFTDAETLSQHIKQHMGDRPFVCNICGKCFPQRFNLELHLRTHTGERPFQCDICKNGYVSKASLKIHMRTHTNERPFVCDFCGKAFRQSGDLTSHKRLHGTEKPIECSVCQKRFTTVMKLKYHMRNHTGERPYVCNLCGRGFTVNTILLRHMRVHSGERPYVCVICGKAFSQSSTLNTHMRVHQPNPNKTFAQAQQPAQPPPPPAPPVQQERMKYEAKYEPHMQQIQDTRMLQQQQPEVRFIPDAGHLMENKMMGDAAQTVIANDGTRLLLNVADGARFVAPDNRLIAGDNRLLTNVNDGRHLGGMYDPYHRGQI